MKNSLKSKLQKLSICSITIIPLTMNKSTFKPNWVTLGNQLDGFHLEEADMTKRYRARYPDGIVRRK